jgi:type II secretory pathway pseudopilin PulG
MSRLHPLLREALLVLLLFLVLGALGFINLAQARREKNEKHARIMMQVFHRAQGEFRSQLQNNRDGDEEGEFGALPQLVGLKETWSYRQFEVYTLSFDEAPQSNAVADLRVALGLPEPKETVGEPTELPQMKKKKPGPKKPERTDPPKDLYTSSLFNPHTQELVFDGYVYRVCLPQLRMETQTMTEDDKVKAKTDDVEKYWCAYAWPYRYGRSGQRSYFIDFSGQLYTRDDPKWTGTGRKEVQAMDAYEGREFETPVDRKKWQLWAEVQPKPQPAKTPEQEKEEKEKEGKEGSPGDLPPVTAGTTPEGGAGKEVGEKPAGPASPTPPVDTTAEEKERQKKLIEEAGSETGLERKE